jgi:carbamoyl-phosphate synthase large subunit
MKATGEVMSICHNFEGALMKAIRSLEQHVDSLMSYDFTGLSEDELIEELKIVDDRRIWRIAEAIRRDIPEEYIHRITKIDRWFIDKIAILVEMEQALKSQPLTRELLLEAKRMEFPDNVIASITGKTEAEIKAIRGEFGIKAAYKMVDTCAAEFAAATPYYYSVYGDEGTENEAIATPDKKKILVLGSGPIRIGQGIEFDFCSVHCTWAFAKEGYETIIVNNNPETVSTDFDIADKLYFEPLTPEDVENIVNIEKPDGAVVQFGGQTAIKLTEALIKMGVKILGTSAEDVDAAEDRELFDEILEKCQIPRAKGQTVFTAEEAKKAAGELGYPVLVRPSYVLGGQGMRIAVSDEDIEEYIGVINQIAQEHPILVDKYLMGKEIEVDAVCDGEQILIPGIMEHIERAGIHSGDSISVYPAQTISEQAKETITEYTRRLAKALHVIGMINIQFIVYEEQVYVIEVNPRSSRTVPYISKVTGIPIVPLATKVILGYKLKDMGYEDGLQPEAKYFAIKMPVFSFEKIRGADISLGPEMKSTGECLGIAETFNEALYKAFIGAGIRLPKHKNMIITVKDEDKEDIVPIARRFEKLGYRIYATRGTAAILKENGIKVIRTNKLEQPSPNLMDLILGHKIDVVIDTPPQGAEHQKDGFVIRRNAIETGVNVLTALDTAEALVTSLENTDLNNLTLIDIATIAGR